MSALRKRVTSPDVASPPNLIVSLKAATAKAALTAEDGQSSTPIVVSPVEPALNAAEECAAVWEEMAAQVAADEAAKAAAKQSVLDRISAALARGDTAEARSIMAELEPQPAAKAVRVRQSRPGSWPPLDAVIRAGAVNPHSPHTLSYREYAVYRDGMTVREYQAVGGQLSPLQWHRRNTVRGQIHVYLEHQGKRLGPDA